MREKPWPCSLGFFLPQWTRSIIVKEPSYISTTLLQSPVIFLILPIQDISRQPVTWQTHSHVFMAPRTYLKLNSSVTTTKQKLSFGLKGGSLSYTTLNNQMSIALVRESLWEKQNWNCVCVCVSTSFSHPLKPR